MKIVSIAALLARAMAVSTASAGEVWEQEISVMKPGEGALPAIDTFNRERHEDEGGCGVETDALMTCFNAVEEADGSGCWDCVAPDPVPDNCADYCQVVEQCRRDTCHSGSACADQFYSTLTCVLGDEDSTEGCNCVDMLGGGTLATRSAPLSQAATEAKEETQQAADVIHNQEHSEELSADVCDVETNALITCFESAKEADSEGCWECTVPDTTPDNCADYCMVVEQCRSDTCHSDSACVDQFYSTLTCVLGNGDSTEGCNCVDMLGGGTLATRSAPLSQAATEAKEETQQAADVIHNQEHSEELSADVCGVETNALITCFESAKEADSEGCWDCALRDTTPDNCADYCMVVEQCRSDTCHSGPACAGQFYSTLNCMMGFMEWTGGCNCDESGGASLATDRVA